MKILILCSFLMQLAAAEPEHQAIRALLQQKKYADALSAAKALNQRVPDDVTAYELLAWSHAGLGEWQQAEKAAQWMLDLQLGRVTPDAARVVAAIRRNQKDYTGAIQILTVGFRRVPPADAKQRASFLREMAAMYEEKNDVEQAMQLRVEARRLDPDR